MLSNDFEDLTAGVTQVYKNIQRIKKQRMNSLGLKGTQVMCTYYLSIHLGMTAADLPVSLWRTRPAFPGFSQSWRRKATSLIKQSLAGIPGSCPSQKKAGKQR